VIAKIPKTLPDCAARVIRSHLDYLLTQAASKVPPPVLPPDADEVERSVHAYRHDPTKALLESESNFTRLKFAEAHPQSFWNRYGLGSRI